MERSDHVAAIYQQMGRASAKPCKYVATTTHNEAIKSIPVHAWNDDVEVQATSLTTHLREVLEKAQQPIKEGPKKPYIDDVTWKNPCREDCRSQATSNHQMALAATSSTTVLLCMAE